MPKHGLSDDVLIEAKRIIANGHSVMNAARLLSKKFSRKISGYVLRYWLDEGFRERKQQKVRERNAKRRLSGDTRRESEGESKTPSR